MDYTNCNLCHPKLRAKPSYGDAIRYHAESEPNEHGLLGIHRYGDEFTEYLAHGTLSVDVDWGVNQWSIVEHFRDAGCFNNGDGGDTTTCSTLLRLCAQMTVHGIGRRPAMTLVASNSIQINVPTLNNGDDHTVDDFFPKFCVKWRHDVTDDTLQLYPEYVVRLQLSSSHDDAPMKNYGLVRHLHVVPPPIGRLEFRLSDIIWAPYLFSGGGEDRSTEVVDSILLRRRSVNNQRSKDDNDENHVVSSKNQNVRRRGFGLELETVQLPPNAENDCFTHQQQFVQSVERAREWHLTRVCDNDKDVVQSVNELYDELLLWKVSHDLYVENAAPPTRIDLYQQVIEHIQSNGCDSRLSNDTDAIQTLNELILGGRVEIPENLLQDDVVVPEQQHIPTSQASPEYKSPLPPNELYHIFPPPNDGRDDATDSIRLVLDGVLKNEAASSRGVVVPTVSDIGQSGTSIHVHVNVTNSTAWPREALMHRGDVEATSSLLCVIFGWICFDRVVGCHFNMPNVWRDKSFAPMYVTGPEFSWNEVSWRHGQSIVMPEHAKDVKLNNFPAWFSHVYSVLKSTKDEEKKEQESISLFDAVFDHEVLKNTISRWNSLNLLSLQPYGTVEFRRMHATLDAGLVSAWTWFCVGFVEKFSQPEMFDGYLYPFLSDATSMEAGLERLLYAQNNATIEDLYEIMCGGDEPTMPSSAFDKLICKRY